MITKAEGYPCEISTPKEREGKPRAIFDIDDLLAKTREGYVTTLNDHFGTHVAIEEVDGWVQDHPAWKNFGPELENYMEELRSSPEFNFNLEPVEGALEAVQTVARETVVIPYVTFRPATVYQATSNWLHLHGFPEGVGILCRPTWIPFEQAAEWKEQTIRSMNPDFVFEDSVHMAQRLKGITVFLVERPHNKNFTPQENHIVKASWSEVPALVRLKKAQLSK